MSRNIILDCDTGVDDALAIMLALCSTELCIKALTVSDGNVHIDQCALNTARIANFMKEHVRPDIKLPVIAQGIVNEEQEYAGACHGADGLGGISDELAFEGEGSMINSDALGVVKNIFEECVEKSEELTVIVTGPMTNLAQWIGEFPDLAQRAITEVVVMGGAFFNPGNVTPHAEFNIYSNPAAAMEVINFCAQKSRRIPVTFAGLDVTHRVFTSDAIMDCLLKKFPGNIVLETMEKMTRVYLDFHITRKKHWGCPLHDPLAVGYAIAPEMFTLQPGAITVDTTNGETKGKTTINPQEKETNAQACAEINTLEFEYMFFSRVTGIPADKIKACEPVFKSEVENLKEWGF